MTYLRLYKIIFWNIIIIFLVSLFSIILYEVYLTSLFPKDNLNDFSKEEITRVNENAHDIILKEGKRRYIRINENPVNSEFYSFPGKNIKSFEHAPSYNKSFHVKVDDHGFIGNIKPYYKKNINIIFSGGSTTENRYVKNEYRFPILTGTLLSKEKNLEVLTYNDGKSGRNGIETIIKTLLNNVELKPKAIIFYHNVNSLFTFESIKADTPYNRRLTIQHETKVKKNIFSLVFPETEKKLKYFYNRNFDVKIKKLPTRNFSYDRFKSAHENFKRHLLLFISICNIYNVTPVLMTQPSLLSKNIDKNDIFLNDSNIDENSKIENLVTLHQEFNEIIKSVGEEKSVLVIDLAKAYSWTQKEIYDGWHFSKQGNIIAAEFIKEKLYQKLIWN